ncbi:MAG: N-acetylmuramoyl-L-alanine amidase, partial [Clostridia bacterium]|nr:N-acetylmuramoyl-L-alanine amidase [Clostridia bacterium]
FSILLFSASALNVVLDPGHGEKSPGCAYYYDGKEVVERDLNHKMARMLKNELKNYRTRDNKKINVYITCKRNQNPALHERVKFGKKRNADLLLSMHLNASPNRNIKGAMVLVTHSHYQPGKKLEKKKSRKRKKRKNDLYAKEEKLAKKILKNLKNIGVTIPKNVKSDEAELKDGLLRRPSDDGDTYPNGDASDWYGIIRSGIRYNLLSILVEHAHLSNRDDYYNFLSTDEKLKSLVRADALGIAEYYGLVLKK